MRSLPYRQNKGTADISCAQMFLTEVTAAAEAWVAATPVGPQALVLLLAAAMPEAVLPRVVAWSVAAPAALCFAEAE
jgi:hypothetical protein